MPLLIHEIIERLLREDEVSLLELLEINSELILERFSDRVEDRMDYLENYLDEE